MIPLPPYERVYAHRRPVRLASRDAVTAALVTRRRAVGRGAARYDVSRPAMEDGSSLVVIVPGPGRLGFRTKAIQT